MVAETANPPHEGPESKLHEFIADDLRRRRWYFVHSRMDARTTTAKGVPDFICAAPGGLTCWLEIKRKGGKLTPEQTVVRHVLLALGHRYATIWSKEDYLQFVEAQLTSNP